MATAGVPEIPLPTTIKLWPVKDLVPYHLNPRLHTEEEVDELVEQIRLRGWTNPILIDENAGILAGHRRLRAALKLKMKHVPVIVLTHLGAEEKLALLLADNQTTIHGSWDTELVRATLALMEAGGLDIGQAAFTDDEIRALERHDPFKPATDPVTGGQQVTQGDVDAADGAKKDKLWQEENLHRVTCPECGSDFYIKPEVV